MARYKLNIQPYGSGRVLIYDNYGLDPETINQINDVCLKEEWRDVYFATLDDKRIGLVCKPTTFVKLMGWRNKKYGKKFPVNLKKEFMKAANEALHGVEVQEYKEELNKEEKEIKKHVEEEVHKYRAKKDKKGEDKTWKEEK